MRAVLQRVQRASVEVGGEVVGAIEAGLLIFVGVGHGDTLPDAGRTAASTTARTATGAGASAQATAAADATVSTLAKKIANLRIFADETGRSNLSLLDTGGAALVISQFTLYADTRRGRRPSFTDAADPGPAEALVEGLRSALGDLGIPTASGRFGTHMTVALVNDGPYTIVLDTEG